MLVSRLLDGVSDIIMGIIIDKTKSKYGKARPWLMRMIIPLMISYVLMFSVPDIGNMGKIIYVFITYNLLTTVFYTAATIPYNTMLSLVTRSQHERSVLNIFRMIFAFTGSIVVSAVTLPLVNAFGGQRSAWTILTLCFSVVLGVCYTIVFATQREVIAESDAQRTSVPVREGLSALVRNKYWGIMLLICVLSYLATGSQGVSVYFVTYNLNDAGLMGLMTVFGLAPAIVGMLIMPAFLKRFGKRNVAMVGLIISIAGCILMAAGGTNIPVVVAGLLIKGFGSSPLIATIFALINDTVEYGEWKTGLRTEGLVNSAASFGIKVGTGLGSALVGWALAWGGYQANVAVQTPKSLSTISALYIWMPALMYALIFVLFLFYKLDKEYDGIMKDLAHRQQAAAPVAKSES